MFGYRSTVSRKKLETFENDIDKNNVIDIEIYRQISTYKHVKVYVNTYGLSTFSPKSINLCVLKSRVNSLTYVVSFNES